jgi:hypothetical protein
MEKKSKVLGGAVGLIAIAVLIVGFFVVRPVLAQEEPTTTDQIVGSAQSTDAVSSSTSGDTPVDASASGTPPAEGASTSAVTTDASSPPPAADTPAPSSESAAASYAAQPDPAADVTPTEPPPAGFTRAHIVGTKYTDYFTDGINVTSYPGDPAIDSNLDKPSAPVPTHVNLTWVHTTGNPVYDTPSGDLEPDYYYVQSDGSVIAKYPPFQSSTSTPATQPSE